MGKYKMPDAQQFLKKKRIYGPKPDPVWVYLEREMRENIDKKPYNQKVGEWLTFLQDLKYYYFCEERRKHKRLYREAGPPWYYELSSSQRVILSELKTSIHQDILEDIPVRIKRSLWELGITLRFPHDMLMRAMTNSAEDPGLFLWNLYTAYYKKSPSILLPKYDMNAMIIMSSLVFIDMAECKETMIKLTNRKKRPPPPPPKNKKKYFQPNVRYGEYLQKMYVPCYSNHPLNPNKKKKKPAPLDYKIRLRSEESYTRLCEKFDFLEKRAERNRKEKQVERVCHYKFWEPPSTLRNTDPKMAAYILKLKMFKKKCRARYLKYKPPFDNLQCHIGTVTYTGGQPRFLLNNYCSLPTGYIPHNGGVIRVENEYVTNILGHWKYPRDTVDKCDSDCGCLTRWDGKVQEYLQDSRCKCGHNFDLYNEGKCKEKYFYQPTKKGPMWFDQAKIFQMDPTEDFIRDTVRDAVKSLDPSPGTSQPTISASGLKEKELLGAIFADLADSPLLTPHLPKANLLNNLQEWIRERIKGDISPKKHKKMLLQSQRRWLDLKHMDFRARAYSIPFTLKQLSKMNYSHRHEIQKLFDNLLLNFTARNRKLQVEQTRMWWSTMKFDAYPSQAFLDIFFTYMPGRYKDTFIINPYSSERTKKSGGKTCPL